MLILTRKSGEGILIGNDIVIKIFEIEGDRVKIGIDAPKSMKVLRQELYEDISRENKMAASAGKAAFDKLLKNLKEENSHNR
ncbi:MULTISPECIES: carbon storage regulator CsrA [Tepidanaerobacter]|uniref:carbon storage regulator CsrA n=1 Tax=Tepidanaerobacter TaxID=499228 RepID=UPI000AA63523|nr:MULTISPECIES: carbon storage regulator CsrA [Tepidanaerobacter]GLI18338.1 carbon storage regulator [Tepidanaerobacter syntrophicus]HHV82800.1 carbon storage regulator CsrA [Tepidanaerobacter syntrophicus]